MPKEYSLKRLIRAIKSQRIPVYNSPYYKFTKIEFPFSMTNSTKDQLISVLGKSLFSKIEQLTRNLYESTSKNKELLDKSEEIFGAPFFDMDKIANYDYITSPRDFLI